MTPRPQAEVRRLALAVAAITLLLAVVALASRGHRFVGGSAEQRRLSSDFVDYLVSLALAFGVIALVTVGLVAKWGRVETSMLGGKAKRSLLRRIFPWAFLLFVIVVLAFAHPRIRLPGLSSHDQKPTPAATTRHAGAKRNEKQAGEPEHHLRWLPVALLLGTGLSAILAAGVVRWQREREDGEDLPLAEALSDVLDETLDDLRGEGDPRRAVIAAYARMERTLAAYGLPRRSFEAPLEYLARVLAELSASERSVRRLTDLFERARFSRHEIDVPMKDDAIAALTSLRAELVGTT
jgi:hypothetical protein